jgi:hypothetical protein
MTAIVSSPSPLPSMSISSCAVHFKWRKWRKTHLIRRVPDEFVLSRYPFLFCYFHVSDIYVLPQCLHRGEDRADISPHVLRPICFSNSHSCSCGDGTQTWRPCQRRLIRCYGRYVGLTGRMRPCVSLVSISIHSANARCSHWPNERHSAREELKNSFQRLKW